MSLPRNFDALSRLRDSGLTLHKHQIEGIQTILEWYDDGHGGILADEMGLGKTCQTICALVLLTKKLQNPKFVVICPLSVIEHWKNEVSRFGCGQLKSIVYKGTKEVREQLLQKLNTGDWNVCLTTYSFFRIDSDSFNFNVDAFVVDEAHSVKNELSQLHQAVRQKNAKFHLLLTGTPIQNDLDEFYALLSLADSVNYSEDAKSEFLSQKKEVLVKKLKEATEKYVLRRLKTIVCKELPISQEVVLYHGLTNFQRDLYNAILVSNRAFFETLTAPKQSLMSLLVQLRKAVSHPYLFQGVEPEPFTEGEHLFTASGKFMVLDKLLNFLKKNNHRCLIFSQYKRTLEILADAMTFRGYNYEHFDGSSKAEDRFQSIDNFQRPNSDVFCFLITTKAGGQGLTLTAADTVIFVDSDVNPQNDLQAAARCHRIGQDKPVKVIRLLAEHTVDEAIQKRAFNKLKLSEFVLEDKGGTSDLTGLKEVLLSDLAKLNEAGDSSEQVYKLLTDEYLVSLLGKTDENGHWMNEISKNLTKKESLEDVDFFPRSERIVTSNKSKLIQKDEEIFEELTTKFKNGSISTNYGVRKTLKINPVSAKPNSDSGEAEARRRANRTKARQRRIDADKKRAEAKRKIWEDNNYQSKSVSTLLQDMDGIVTKNHKPGRVYRVFGNVVDPVRSLTDNCKEAWIIHRVDTGGHWGTGGLFTILQNLSSDIPEAYNLAGKMSDLHVGDSHFLDGILGKQQSISNSLFAEIDLDSEKTHTEAAEKLERIMSVQLMVAQSLRDRHRLVMTEANVKKCFKTISEFALKRKVLPSIHMPMIWWGLPNPQLEKIVLKCITKEFLTVGIDVYIYHYRRGHSNTSKVMQPSRFNLSQSLSRKYSNSPPAKRSRIEIVEDDEEEEIEEIEEDESEEEEVFTETETEEEDLDLELTDGEEDEIED